MSRLDIVMAIIVIVACLIVLAFTGPSDVQAERDVQADLAAAKAQAAQKGRP